jgi:hypothetical protein
MCDECHQSPCATMCPNNTALADDDPIMKTCPICEREYDEDWMEESVCAACMKLNMTWENAEKYGDKRKINVEVNAFWAKLFTPSMINEILKEKALEFKGLCPYMAQEDVENFFDDDPSDFADWLKEHENID